jgi:subtilase family serine protease
LTPSFTSASTHLALSVRRNFASLARRQAPTGRVIIGTAPLAPRHSEALGDLAGSSELSVAIALEPRNAAALSNFATAVSTPGSAAYRHYLTVGQFRAKFGASSKTIAAVRQAMSRDGLRLSATGANGLSFNATGQVRDINRAFATKLERVRLPSGRIAFSNASVLSLPKPIGHDVQAVIGLSNVFVPHREGLLRAARRRAAASTSATADPRDETIAPSADSALTTCPGAASEAASETDLQPAPDNTSPNSTAAYTGQQIAQAYDFDPLYASSDEGQGVTVGVFELEPNFPADISTFESCYGITAPVTYTPEDGGVGTPNASNLDGLETELDIEDILELAPQASVDVFQAPDTPIGLYNDYASLVQTPGIQVISSSWGECETDIGSAYANAENTIFQQAAAEGISIAAAAGNSGAQDCVVTQLGPISTASDSTATTAAVDDPASQPFVTGVGGTSLNALGDQPTTAPAEVVWNNGETLAAAGEGGGGGGGVSALWQMPGWQRGAATALNVINSESSRACHPLVGDCREVPDVSADADPYTSYVVYWDGGWTTVGGTSGAAPVWAALFADADANEGCAAHGGIGFANPDLYGAAGNSTADYASYFNDITSGNNDVYGTNSGEFAAGSAYDMASGLGTPIAGNLVPALCAEAAALDTPTPTTPTTVTDTVTAPTTSSSVTTTTLSRSSTTTVVTQTIPAKTVTSPATSATVISPALKVTLPSGSSPAFCHVGAKLGFVQHPIYPVDETKSLVYVNRKLVKKLVGKRIVDVVIRRPKATRYRLTLIATLSNGEVVEHTVVFNGCRHGKLKTKVLHKVRALS